MRDIFVNLQSTLRYFKRNLDISCQGQEELISSNLSLRLESLKECGGWTVDPNHAAICSVGYGNDDDDDNGDND